MSKQRIMRNPGKKGIEYENKTFNTIKGMLAEHRSIIVNTSETFNHYESDLTLIGNGWQESIELKQNIQAQMGSTSIHFNPHTKSIEIASPVQYDDVFTSSVYRCLDDKSDDIKLFLKFFQSPSFPFQACKETWVTAQTAGLLSQSRVITDQDTSFIIDHYRNKNTNYIQIGGLGLFHLGNNALKLPIPKLTGRVRLEIRAVPSKTHKRKSGDHFVYVQLRVTAKLLPCGQKSAITLDTPEGVASFIKVLPK